MTYNSDTNLLWIQKHWKLTGQRELTDYRPSTPRAGARLHSNVGSQVEIFSVSQTHN